MNLFCSNKKWLLPEYDISAIEKLCSELKISEVLAMVLLRRGISDPDSARWFMNTEALYLYNPYLLCDMDKAVNRIRAAIKNNEKICIYGDYDVDGITSIATLYRYLHSKMADVTYYIPKRLTEGYGMNIDAIEKLSGQGVQLIITVDNGICANAEIEYATKLGIDVVVTDHHECRGEIPECCAVVNPQRPDNEYPFVNLAGVGVVFKLICALEGEELTDDFYNRFIDLVSLGTISDVMPLVDENRQIVARGLKMFSEGSNAGVMALLDEASFEKNKRGDRKIKTSTVGFTVAPRLNAAGRIGDAEKAVELLICDNYFDCLKTADELCSKNRERQYIENRIYNDAVAKILQQHDFEKDKVIVVSGENWHHGVVGIVASKITEKFGLPSILICLEDGIGKGSARSIPGFNINEAIYETRNLLVKSGGHELAAGLTIESENISEFKEKINDYARDKITQEMRSGSVEIDAEIDASEITLELCEEIEGLEPYGKENPVPLLYMRDVRVTDVISLGQNKHTKVILQKNGMDFEGLYFGFCPDNFIIPKSSLIDIAFNLEINDFRGVRNPQLLIKDIRLCKEDARKVVLQEEVYKQLLCGERPELVPGIELCRAVYSFLRNNEAIIDDYVNIYAFTSLISKKIKYDLEFSTFAIMIDIFAEMGLCELIKSSNSVVKIKLNKMSGKVDLESSEILKKARHF